MELFTWQFTVIVSFVELQLQTAEIYCSGGKAQMPETAQPVQQL